MDILGPVTPSQSGNQYVLMVIDQFTKWVECYPLPHQTAELVAKTFLDQFIARLGSPSQIHMDQGSNFNSNLFRSLCDLMQVTKTCTTQNQPCSNGQL